MAEKAELEAVEHQISNVDHEKSRAAYVTETNAASVALGACHVYHLHSFYG